eukprot:UN25028
MFKPLLFNAQYGVRPPSASMIARMILGYRSIIFRVASIGRIFHWSSSVYMRSQFSPCNEIHLLIL